MKGFRNSRNPLHLPLEISWICIGKYKKTKIPAGMAKGHALRGLLGLFVFIEMNPDA